MNLIPFKKRDLWSDSFDGFESLENEISNFFSPMFKREGSNVGLLESEWSPSIDVYDSDNELLVKADIPGLKKEDIDVSIHDNVLTIKGEKKRKNEVNKKNYYRSERFYGSFNRSVELGSEVQTDKVNATYKDGVLELKLPKKEGVKTKRIAIDVK